MKFKHSYGHFFTQRGVGLVELMITMVIGLIILIALGYFFLGSRQINRVTDDVSRMQESGRNALELIGRAVRQAGYRNNPDVAFTGTALTGTNAGAGESDEITIQYDAQEGGEDDCEGTNVPTGLVTYAFAVDNTVNPPVLTCNGTVVVDNIEELQIDYGIDTEKDGIIDTYKTDPTATEFGHVAAVRVTLLVRGPSPNITTNQSQTYTYNGNTLTETDGHLRQVYSATFTVRNQAG